MIPTCLTLTLPQDYCTRRYAKWFFFITTRYFLKPYCTFAGADKKIYEACLRKILNLELMILESITCAKFHSKYKHAPVMDVWLCLTKSLIFPCWLLVTFVFFLLSKNVIQTYIFVLHILLKEKNLKMQKSVRLKPKVHIHVVKARLIYDHFTVEIIEEQQSYFWLGTGILWKWGHVI
jgi:hypothetical protein